MAIRVEPPAMQMELIMYLPMGASFQMSTKFCHSHSLGNTAPLAEKISLRLFSAVVNMTK